MGHSIQAQIDKLTKYCEAMGLNIYKVYTDEGVSGGKPLESRKAGKDLANDIKQNKITHIISYSLSRLFRDLVDGLTNIRLWDKKGISLVLLDVGGSLLDTSSAMGKMMLSVMLACNELERNLVGERVSLVHQNKIANKKVWTRSVYGYNRAGDDLVPNDYELAIVSKMKAWRSSGYSYQRIANILNRASVPTKEGKSWFPMSIKQVLGNTIHHQMAS
jgi:site-specific DNA recombinase